MNETAFKVALIGIATTFTFVFCGIVIPPLIINPDIMSAFAAGFVNPYAAGYSADVLFCWSVLAIWVIYESKAYSVKYGWACLVLGVIPGVAVGFPLYLITRNKQIIQTKQKV